MSMAKTYGKLLIIDGSYQAHRNQNIKEFQSLSYNGMKTGMIFGTLRSISTILKQSRGYFPVVCWDNGLSDRRLQIFPDYKHNLDRQFNAKVDALSRQMMEDPDSGSSLASINDSEVDEIEAARIKVSMILENRRTHGSDYLPDSDEERRAEYSRQRDHLIKIMRGMGIPQLLFRGYEGDDLITMMTRVCEKSRVVTDDRDMIQLTSPDVEIHRPLAKEIVTYDKIINEWKSTPRTYLIAKAIVGDGSDNIPQATYGLENRYCVGGVSADHIARIISECDEDPARFIPALRETKLVSKNRIEGFIQRLDHYYRNMTLIDLSLVPDDIDTYGKIDAEIETSNRHLDYFSILELVGSYGLSGVDFQSIVDLTSFARSNMYASERRY